MRGRTLLGTALLVITAGAQVGVAHAAAPPEHGYVTNAFHLPSTNAEATSFGRDLDGDKKRDNQLGRALVTLAGQGLDLRAAQDDAIASGDIVMLHSLRASSLANTRNATWQVLYGEPTAEPDLSGTGSFVVALDQPRSARLDATIKDHLVRTSPGRIPVQLDLGVEHEFGQMMTLGMKQAVVTATCTRHGCLDGKISGALTTVEIDTVLIPELAALLQSFVARDCPGPGPESCQSESSGQTIQAIFDTDNDLQVTADEVRENSLMQAVLAPDLDLAEADGSRGHDGVMDAISFGFGFTAAPATLVRP